MHRLKIFEGDTFRSVEEQCCNWLNDNRFTIQIEHELSTYEMQSNKVKKIIRYHIKEITT